VNRYAVSFSRQAFPPSWVVEELKPGVFVAALGQPETGTEPETNTMATRTRPELDTESAGSEMEASEK
jgi:hypothetical protein